MRRERSRAWVHSIAVSTKFISIFLFAAAVVFGQIAPPASEIFDKDAVHEIRLTFKQSDWYEQLTAIHTKFRDNTPYIEASLSWGEHQFDSVGVRFKGTSSYSGARTRKKPFRIKLNEFVKGQKIDGMASFGLNNFWNDPSFVREKPYYELAASAGLPAARSSFAALYVNDEYLGLYGLGEIVNGDFLESHFVKSDVDGNLYKATDPGANLAYLGADPAPYQRFFSKESNEETNDWTDLIELARIFEETPAAELPSKLGPLVDIDSFLKALALDNLTVNLDSYVGMAQNYYLYRRSSDRKWVWIPWDPSLAFGALSQGFTVQQMKDLSLQWVQPGSPASGVIGRGRPVAAKLWQVAEYKQRYREIYQQLVDRILIPSEVIGRMNVLRDMIRPWVENDTQKLVTMTQFESAMTLEPASGGGGFPEAPGLQPFIEGRVASVKAQLAGQTPPLISAAPLSLLFVQVADLPASAPQELAVSLPGALSSVMYSATASAQWITLSGATGAFPARVVVTTNSASMAVGTYTGSVSIATTGTANSPLNIPVTLTVVPSPALVASPSSLTFTGGGTGGPLTQMINVLSTAGRSPFVFAISDSTCNNFVAAAASSGTTPGAVTVSVNGATTSGTCTARITISSPGLTAAVVPVTLTIAAGPGGNPGTPAVSAIVNSGSYASGPVSPGTLLTIFGANVAARNLVQGAFANGQLATNVGGLQVLFDGVPAPILYARFDQIGVVVPFEMSGKTQVTVQVSTANGQTTVPIQQTVSPTSPAIYTIGATGTGQASVINENGAVNGATAAAPKGSTVAIYMTGAGQMTPAGRSGVLGTAAQAVNARVLVRIGGQNARVMYAGAAPGSLQGLYQINAVVPQDAPSGNVPVQVIVGEASTQAGVTMYVQ